MLDLKLIQQKLDWVEHQLQRREPGISMAEIGELDKRRRATQTESDALKSRQKSIGTEVANRKRAGENADDLLEETKQLAEQIKQGETALREIEEQLHDRLAALPNLPHESVPTDPDKANNVEVRAWGQRKTFDFEPRHHVQLGTSLGILDFERGAKISGTGFPLYVGWGAELEHALLAHFRTENRRRGYTPIFPPILVNSATCYTSSHLPKFADQLYTCHEDGLHLVATAEAPLAGMHRDEIFEEDDLPKHYTAYTPCFRREAGAHGAGERGLVRVHQFNKVELFKYCTPETSYDELEALTKDSEHLLQTLGIHYRTVLLVTGDLGQAAAKTYDVEVWLPGQDRYYEVSSCSNCEDYQARRGNIRYRCKEDRKRLNFVHTLNGSALATSRLMVAILENNQNADGSVTIPEVLRPYLDGKEVLRPGEPFA